MDPVRAATGRRPSAASRSSPAAAERRRRGGGATIRQLEASDDGTRVPVGRADSRRTPHRSRSPPSPRKFFRVSVRTTAAAGRRRRQAAPAVSRGRAPAGSGRNADRRARPARVSPVNRFQDKAAFRPPRTSMPWRRPRSRTATPSPRPMSSISTSKMRADGTARLDPARRPLDRAPLRLLPHRRPQLPGLAGGHRARGRQARPGPRQGLLRQLPRPVQERHRRPHGASGVFST